MRDEAYRPLLPWQGLVAGAVGGLVASWAMEQFQARFSHATDDGQSRPATVEASDTAAVAVSGRRLRPSEQDAAGPLMQYGFGIAVGAIYGALAETRPELTRFSGIPFGMGVWASADQVAVPAAGLSVLPWNRPMRAHTYSLLSHAVYGFTTEAVRKMIRARLR